MIDPQLKDVGRRVIYRMCMDDEQEGTITSYNEYGVFVRYDGDTHSKLTLRQDLSWAVMTPDEVMK